VIRYRTGDLVVRGSAPCACGRTLATIRGGVLGRADDMMIVRGINLYPAAMDDVIRGVPGIAEYEVEVRRTSALDDVVVKVEPGDGRRFPDLERALRQGFRDRFNLRVTVEEAPPDSLPRYELKARRYKRC
jgi:phenylacetate-CoA ligase